MIAAVPRAFDVHTIIIARCTRHLHGLIIFIVILFFRRESIDGLTIPSKNNPGTVLKRIEEVFDCWFESGSMPYAQVR